MSLHNALQGFMCLALQGSDGLRVLKDDVARAWLAAQDSGTPLPVEKLDWFPNLYAKIRSDVGTFRANSRSYPDNSAVNQSVDQLNNLRNEFIHFVPKGWSVELAGLPQICANCINVDEFLIQ